MDRDEFCKLAGINLDRRVLLAIAYSQPRPTDWRDGEQARQAARSEHVRQLQSLATAALGGNESLILEWLHPLEQPITQDDIDNARSVKAAGKEAA